MKKYVIREQVWISKNCLSELAPWDLTIVQYKKFTRHVLSCGFKK